MTQRDLPREPGEIIYHFDVDRSSIPLAQFVDTARATQEIIDDFNSSLFDGKLKYEIRVKTPEEGSLLEVLLVMVTVGGSVLGFLATDIGKAFFKGLTKEEPASWAEKIGTSIREAIADSIEPDHPGAPALPKVESVDSMSQETMTETDVQRSIAAEVIALILLRFLELDTDTLSKIGITPEKFRAAFQGRNRVFKGCIDNPEVKGLAFDRASDFPIKRSEFVRQITQLPDALPAVPITPSNLNFETVDIVVNSPNWKRDGRNWQADTNKHQGISFSIEDEGFWHRVDQRDADIKPTIRDNMRVQWGYPAGATKPSQVKVFRVLSYNGRQLSTPMSEREIQELQNTVHFVEPETPDLFDERRGLTNESEKGAA